MGSTIVLIYTTVGSHEAARLLARAAITQRHAACANIMPGTIAVYEWEGRLEESAEVGILFKTTAETGRALVDFLLVEHPYKVPAIIIWNGECNKGFAYFMQGLLP